MSRSSVTSSFCFVLMIVLLFRLSTIFGHRKFVESLPMRGSITFVALQFASRTRRSWVAKTQWPWTCFSEVIPGYFWRILTVVCCHGSINWLKPRRNCHYLHILVAALWRKFDNSVDWIDSHYIASRGEANWQLVWETSWIKCTARFAPLIMAERNWPGENVWKSSLRHTPLLFMQKPIELRSVATFQALTFSLLGSGTQDIWNYLLFLLLLRYPLRICAW